MTVLFTTPGARLTTNFRFVPATVDLSGEPHVPRRLVLEQLAMLLR